MYLSNDTQIESRRVEQASGLSAESILVDADEIPVEQQALREGTHSAGADVGRDDQRR